MAVKIGFLNEVSEHEKRVAITPISSQRLIKTGLDIHMQSKAGKMAGFDDGLYKNIKIIKNAKELLKSVDILIKLNPPTLDDIKNLSKKSIIISTMFAEQNKTIIDQAKKKNINCYALELIPRITRAQSMDILSSQATCSGYSSIIKAALVSNLLFPMLTTAAGTIAPAIVVVIGAGVAGLQAIATAHRLGARVLAYDIRPDAKEQIESLGAKMIDAGVDAKGDGGYARELNDNEKKLQQEKLAMQLNKADIIITTAAVPGRPAPTIINTKMVDNLKNHCVVVDLAMDSGGNCELSQPNKEITHKNGVKIIGFSNPASSVAYHASQMYAKNIEVFLTLFIKDKKLEIDAEDEILKSCLL
ncbi:MAG: NAD(P)(+) transhydrogenase (Re/Si-specific) subunit alpha [Gammaproteobacteria bacterium]|nr:MAG: NAD(P)(+) transhydrogenase (Re/Si-specific) subunit alpha [Gammaproteobacteria bacterium]